MNFAQSKVAEAAHFLSVMENDWSESDTFGTCTKALTYWSCAEKGWRPCAR